MSPEREREFQFDPNRPEIAGPRRRFWGKVAFVAAFFAVLTGAAGVYLYLVHPHAVREWLQDTPFALDTPERTLYRWRDAEGGVQIADRPPPPGTPYERVQVDPDANVMPLVPRKE